MGLESVTTIGGLVTANPVGGTDPKSQGDDHIRLIKNVLKTTFPNLNGVTTVTPAQLNQLDTANLAITLPGGGVTKMIFAQAAAPTGWTKIVTTDNAALRLVSGTGGGTGGTADFTTVFASRTPVGTNTGTALTSAQLATHSHTQQGSFNTGLVSSDHTHGFSDTSTVESTTHFHGYLGPIIGNLAHDGTSEGDFGVGNGGFTHNTGGQTANHTHVVSGNTGGISANHSHAVTISGLTANNGSGTTHTHTFTGTAMDFAVKYVDVIICSLN